MADRGRLKGMFAQARNILLATALIAGLMLGLLPASGAGTQAAGNTYYVSTDGDDSNPGTESAPWRTIQKAANSVGPGDAVYVHAGTYRELVSLRTSGVERISVRPVQLTNGSKATIGGDLGNVAAGDYLYVYRSMKSNNGAFRIAKVGDGFVRVEGAPFVDESEGTQASIGTPIVFGNDGSGKILVDIGHSNCRNPVINFDHVSYVIVERFQVTGSCHAGVAMVAGSHHNVFRNGKVYGNDRPGIYIASENYSEGNTYNIIEANEIFDNGQNGPGEGVYIGEAYGDDDSDYNHIIDNVIYHPLGGNEGADIKPNTVGTVIEGNVFRDSNSTWGVIILGEGSTQALVYGNILRNCSGSDQWAGAIGVLGPQNMVFNNLIFDLGGLDGIYVGRYPGNAIFNNTISNADVGIGIDNEGPGVANSRIINNLLSGNGNQLAGNASGLEISYNLFNGPSSVKGEHATEANPDFTDRSAGDFHLKASSPAIDAGLEVGLSTDLDGRSRPIGLSTDIGAFESADVSPPASSTPAATETPQVVPSATSTPEIGPPEPPQRATPFIEVHAFPTPNLLRAGEAEAPPLASADSLEPMAEAQERAEGDSLDPQQAASDTYIDADGQADGGSPLDESSVSESPLLAPVDDRGESSGVASQERGKAEDPFFIGLRRIAFEIRSFFNSHSDLGKDDVLARMGVWVASVQRSFEYWLQGLLSGL
jgi:hypothetical protein